MRRECEVTVTVVVAFVLLLFRMLLLLFFLFHQLDSVLYRTLAHFMRRDEHTT